MITRGDVRVREGRELRGNWDREVGSGCGDDIALAAVAESLRSRVSAEVSARVGVVLRGVR